MLRMSCDNSPHWLAVSHQICCGNLRFFMGLRSAWEPAMVLRTPLYYGYKS